MTAFDAIYDRIAYLLDGREGFPAKVTIDFREDGSVRIDGTSGRMRVSREGADADCVITMPCRTFAAILRGELDETAAFMKGEMQIRGEIGLATRISELIRASARTEDQ